MVPATLHYLIRDSSLISIDNDTSARVEPIQALILYTISLADSSGLFVFSGRIDSLLLNSHIATKSTTNTNYQSAVHGVVSKRGRLPQPSVIPIACSSANSSPALRITELLIPLPTGSINVGEKWSDTLSTTICRGKFPLTDTAKQEYELLDLSCSNGGARIHRIVVDTFTGSSTESTNYLSASGSGSGSSILCVERNTGELLESTGQSELRLTVTTTRGVFPFTQKTNTHIEKQ
jgi:hypothetical protein